ncbi:MAG: hypothetical protein PQ612_03880 [Rickettsiales bacterium]|nr:hypothetical protein [Pseudomonadota bacterium]MDA0966247.1 hypothetical protein [Pseudomonadota bacterium]MDG4543088.1 hypothetical protein [Rickettsiales bacterium]MDG4545286.1 hypothetical protein [Rickettsiales bacterium]MDG4547735.1 hypothetical protein [Rickettsiales bacterium]
MAFSQKKAIIIEQIKSNLKFVLVGVAVLAFLTFGFIVAIGVITLLIIAIPILRVWNTYKMNKARNNSDKSRDIDDFIDVDYEIIEHTKKRKK